MHTSLLQSGCRLVPVLVLCLGPIGQTDADPTKWKAPERNPVNLADINVITEFSAEKGQERHILWKAKLGTTSYGGPVVAGGKVFVGTNNQNPRDPTVKGDCGVVICFDAKSGKFLWQLAHEVIANEAQNYPLQGIASTPFVDGDRVYYVSNRAELVCADVNGDKDKPGKGKILWSLDMRKQLGVYPCQLAVSSPVVFDDFVYAVTGNGVDVTVEPRMLPAPNAPSFVAINKRTGAVVWQDASPGKNIIEAQWSSPTIANPRGGRPQAIFPGGDGWLYSFEADTGKLIWKFDCNPKSARHSAANKRRSELCHFVLAMPVVYEDRCYIGVGSNPDDGPGVGHFWCIDVTKRGDVSPVDDIFDPKDPKNKGSALVWHFGGYIDPKPVRGREIYFGRTLSTCVIHDGLLYVAELDGYFHCLDARTGEQYYEYDMRAGTWASPYWVDGKVLLGNEDGDLLIFPHGTVKPKKADAATIEHPIKSPACVADGVLYVMTDSYLYAFGRK